MAFTPDEAWPAGGRVVLQVLSAAKPVTLDEVIAAVGRAAAEGQDSVQRITPMIVARCLLELAEAGVVEIVQVGRWPGVR